MGFFNFLDSSVIQTGSFLTFSSVPVVAFFTLPKYIGYRISMDINSPSESYCPHKSSKNILASSFPSVSLPMELVLSIIEAACDGSDPRDKAHLLRSCALVCRAWSTPVQQLLFRNITIKSQATFDSFSKAVSRATNHGRILSDSVLRMRVILDHNQPSGLRQHSFAIAVTMCPNLYGLSIALFGCAEAEDIIGTLDVTRMRRSAPLFDASILELLRSGPMIKSLQCSNWSESHHSLLQLLDVWPSLEALSISGTLPQCPLSPSQPFPGSLRELRLNFQTFPSVEFMKWLLHNSADTLTTLTFEREPPNDLLEYLTIEYGSTLKSLTLPTCSSSDHMRSIQRCYQLRELRVDNPAMSTSIFRTLPDITEHIAIGLNKNTALQPIIDLVKNNDSLSTITVHLMEGSESHYLLSILKIACAYRGKALSLTKDVVRFRSALRSDLFSGHCPP